MTNTQTPDPTTVVLTDLRSLGLHPLRYGMTGVMIAGVYYSRTEAQDMVTRYRRAAARRAALVASVTR